MKPNEQLEESSLIRNAKEGDMEAFESLVKKYQQMIYAFCRRLTGAHQSADDLAQETFVKAYFSLSAFDDHLPLYPWLRQIAMNSALNYLRFRKRERPLDDEKVGASEWTSSPQDLPDDVLEKAEFEQKFEEALNTLPQDQKRIFVLRFYENLSYEEIARVLHLPPGTVMSRLNRARQKLKLLLADFVLRRG